MALVLFGSATNAALAQSGSVAPVSAADANSEVSASVYYMSSVAEALGRDFDAKLKAKAKQIDALKKRLAAAQKQSAAERAAQQAELARLQDDVVAQLAARDEQLARQVAAFRQDVQAIATTPDGLAALRLYNAGQWGAADVIMKGIVDAVDKAEALASALRRAVPRRQRAELAYQARERGMATTKEAIALYEDVTKVDSGNAQDWNALARLYADESRYEDSLNAARRMLQTSTTDGEKFANAVIYGDVVLEKDPVRAEAVFKMVLDEFRRMAKVDKNSEWFIGLMLDRLSSAQLKQGHKQAARKSLEEAIPLLRRAGNVSSDMRERRLARTLEGLGAVFVALGEADKSEEPWTEAIAIWERLVKKDPDRIDARRTLANCYFVLSIVTSAQGHPEKALTQVRSAVAIDRKLLERDNSYTNRARLADKLFYEGQYSDTVGNSSEAEPALVESAAISRSLLQDQADADRAEKLARTLTLLSKVVLKSNAAPAKAIKLAEEAVTLSRSSTSDAAGKRGLATALIALGAARDRASEFRAARPVLEEAVGLLRIGDREDDELMRELLDSYASVLYGLGKIGDGIDAFEAAAAGHRRLLSADPKSIRLKLMLIAAEWRLAYCRLARREFPASQASLDRVSTLVREVGNAEFEAAMNAADHVARGDWERLQNHPAPALAHYQEAVRMLSQRAGTSPKEPSDIFELMEPKFRIAQLKSDQSVLSEIVATYRKFGGRKVVHRWASSWVDDLDGVANRKH